MSAVPSQSEPLPSLLELAVAQIDKPGVEGLVYIHPTGQQPEYVLLTAARFDRILRRYIGDEGLPEEEFAHGHVEPGMREDIEMGDTQ